jgi:CBS-domain-containing membrane protein
MWVFSPCATATALWECSLTGPYDPSSCGGQRSKITTVEEVMTPEVAYCFEDQDIEEVERVMEKHQIRRLPVLNREKRLVGIVSLGDFATKDDETRAGETLERVSEPSRWSEPRIY